MANGDNGLLQFPSIRRTFVFMCNTWRKLTLLLLYKQIATFLQQAYYTLGDCVWPRCMQIPRPFQYTRHATVMSENALHGICMHPMDNLGVMLAEIERTRKRNTKPMHATTGVADNILVIILLDSFGPKCYKQSKLARDGAAYVSPRAGTEALLPCFQSPRGEKFKEF